jgi:hypothetical protein
MLFLQQEWQISARAAGSIKDGAALGKMTQEFLDELLVCDVAV